MNILYLCDEYPPGRHGGIGTVVQQLARESVRKGHTVVVAGFYDWGYGGEDEFIDKGVKVYRFRRGLSSSIFKDQQSLFVRVAYKFFILSGIFQKDIEQSMKKYEVFLNELIRKYNIDIVEMPDYNDYIRFCNKVVLFPRLPVPTLVKLNGSMTYFAREAGTAPKRIIWEMEHDILMKADVVTGASRYTADKTKEYLEYPSTIDVLYNTIQIPEVPDNVVKKKGQVIYTGTLVEKKGVFQLMQAWNIVHSKHPEATLLMYGKGFVEKLKALLDGSAAKTVFFLGHVDRKVLYERLAESTLAVFPSYAECFALAPMEAMGCGTTIVYSTRTSGPELIDHMQDGILVDPDDIQDMADKICYLLENPEVNERLAEKGRKKIVEQFSASPVVDEHIVYYKNVIQKSTVVK